MLWSEARLAVLEPGMGLLLPSMALHAPVGRTWNSLSINSWFFGAGPEVGPHALGNSSRGASTRLLKRLPWEPSQHKALASSVVYARSMPLERIKELAVRRDQSGDGGLQPESPRCADGPALACAESGCPAEIVSCALLARSSACPHRFSAVWKTPPPGLETTKVWEHCPVSCKRCTAPT